MSTIKVLGIDLGSSSFHVVGRDDTDSTLLRKKYTGTKLLEQLSLIEPCAVAFEACGGSHWLARRCQAMGHEVCLIPSQYVKPYVKGNKSDFIDAAAIGEAYGRPDMRLVAVKSSASSHVDAGEG